MTNSYYRIDLPTCPQRFIGQDIVMVGNRSSFRLRKQVEQFAYYFRREFNYDFVQYVAEDEEDFQAYLFVGNGRLPERIIGACCFRPFLLDWALDWIWLHPYWRNRGILTKCWPILLEQHADFRLTFPLSDAMVEFLKKHGTKQQIASLSS